MGRNNEKLPPVTNAGNVYGTYATSASRGCPACKFKKSVQS